MSGTQSPTSPRYTNYTSVLPDGTELAEQAKDAGVRAAYANGTRGNTQENRSAVMDKTPEQAKANVSPLNAYTDEKGLSPTDAAEIEKHVKDDDLASFRNWVDTLGNEYAKLKKAYDGAGDWHQLRRYIVMIEALRTYMTWITADKSRQTDVRYPDTLGSKVTYVSSNHIFKANDIYNYTSAKYDADLAKRYGYDVYENIQGTINSYINTSGPEGIPQACKATGTKLAQLYMHSILAMDTATANDAYNKFMQVYDYAIRQLGYINSTAVHNLITYYFYCELANERSISDEDKRTAHSMMMQGQAYETSLVTAATAPNERVTDSSSQTTSNTTTSDARVKHIWSLGGWLPAMTRR